MELRRSRRGVLALFLFNDTATTEIYTLSLHDALPICEVTIMSDGPSGYSHFSTHQEHPLKYAKDRMKEEQYKNYKLIVK